MDQFQQKTSPFESAEVLAVFTDNGLQEFSEMRRG
ncbi:hypothetical protein GSU1135 [Geobacter sulfurreducens PCA]|uniref:Uncharacterized protein n=1 Tax=Geobacter sulfurreducens (strain ATCC 51573 / DSM 12127 / PCA) TaxID=243231 RepID=Q74E29_GEOSL|nr:hypothetical protein GSU1135 [Geobacter sulfurreducens PCA]ADN78335.1 hypothetical protein KN400_3438 [Geobacter sulfurreducens KN400]AJY70856.1 hypothetical protein RW64_15355 [Geobacter sulfurreducens]HBB69789.1 hypothetical protein [Geobacter sulfurreducens]HCD95570.1 hypothetical protein [Geobacter sulfurreducens]